jgi:hypothetical protein
MKSTLLLLGLTFTASLLAADASKILLKGTTVSVAEAKAVGAARAIVGDMTLSADAIVFEQQGNILKCEGAVTIQSSGHVATARDCTIQLSPGDKKLFFLSSGEIQVSPPSSLPFAPTDRSGRPSDREKLLLEFRSRLLDHDLNQQPVTTPTVR